MNVNKSWSNTVGLQTTQALLAITAAVAAVFSAHRRRRVVVDAETNAWPPAARQPRRRRLPTRARARAALITLSVVRDDCDGAQNTKSSIENCKKDVKKRSGGAQKNSMAPRSIKRVSRLMSALAYADSGGGSEAARIANIPTTPV